MAKTKKLSMQAKAVRDIRQYGEVVLNTSYFDEAFRQTHHRRSSVGDHTLNVSMTSLRISYMLEKFHITTNRENLVLGTLCHDLGILGRTKKFQNQHECNHRHPVESVTIARELVPELNSETEEIIRRHMFPLTILPPNNREGLIVSIADKYCAVKELFGESWIQNYQDVVLGR